MTALDAARVGAATALSEVAGIRVAVIRLTDEVADAGRWPGEERHRVLADLEHVVDAVSAVRATVLVAERDARTWQGSGDRSIEDWWARTSRAGRRVAAAQIRQAEHLDAAPAAAAAAVTEGRIGLEHAVVLGAMASAATPAQRDALMSPAGQQQLLEQAERQDAGTFATAVSRWAATLDPAGLEQDHQAQRRERYLRVSHTSQGTFIRGRLDTMAGRRLTSALEALSPRPGAEDDRDPGQRCADALDAMAARVIAAADTTPGACVPPQVIFILTEETWVAARADRDRRRARPQAAGHGRDDRLPTSGACNGVPTASDAAGAIDGAMDTAYPPATLEDGTPVPVSELAAAMCDCEITRLVIDADGAPLDVGRAQRVFTAPQRRAVITRDRECAWPDCRAPARWCEVHHIRWWERDSGPTSVDNGVLLCSYHHHEVHRQDLAIARIAVPRHRRAPGSGPSGTVALAAYEFRDTAGRVVAPRPTATPAAGDPPVRTPDLGPPPQLVTSEVEGATPPEPAVPHPRSGPGPGPGLRPRPGKEPGNGPSNRPGKGPEFEWAEDPVTGMRVPSFLLDP